ncbi:MAG: hypothetical protein ABDH66_03355 [Bacteroidia bacterium]
MKARWIEGAELAEIWEKLPYSEAPFDTWEWWERLPMKWSAICIEESGAPICLIPFAVRRLGLIRLYRQPLSVPWIPFRLAAPLPETRAAKYSWLRRLLSSLVEWTRQEHLVYIAGALGPEWCYLPALTSFRVKGHGSFVLRVGEFSPSKELLRKVRQVEKVPLQTLLPEEAYEWWLAHRPPGVSTKLAAQLRPLLSLYEAWHIVGLGTPLQAVAFFLKGRNRVWYMTSAHAEGAGQSVTRLLYEAILLAHSQGKDFDFQGSTLPGVERFFRQFGGEWEVRYFISAWRF